MAYYNTAPLQSIMNTWASTTVDAKYEFNEAESNTIAMTVGSAEMLKITKDGFYVRGVRVPADAKEAETVYEAFKSYLIWAKLNEN